MLSIGWKTTTILLSVPLFVLCILQKSRNQIGIGVAAAYSPFVGRKHIVGIWHLSNIESSLLPDENNYIGKGKNERLNNYNQNEFILKLNENGCFEYVQDTSDADNKYNKEHTKANCENDDNNNDGDNFGTVTNAASILSLAFLKGSWEYRQDDKTLILATDRPPNYDGRHVHDTMLIGKLAVEEPKMPTNITQKNLKNKNLTWTDEKLRTNREIHHSYDNIMSVPSGQVCVGKFTYPRRHAAFFGAPMMFKPTEVGTFSLKQVLSTFQFQQQHQGAEDAVNEPEKKCRYHKTDFYGKTFYLTIVPVEPKQISSPLKWDRIKGWVDDHKQQRHQGFDLRVMPIIFFANNTFSANGTNKILRGRYEITGEEREQLWFQVSLFGAGRSMPGSVYSEGIGLTHEDKRTYVGLIQEQQQQQQEESILVDSLASGHNSKTNSKMKSNGPSRMFVSGTATFGSDLGSDARPEPVGLFTMTEVLDENLSEVESDLGSIDDHKNGANNGSFE